jgi:transposase
MPLSLSSQEYQRLLEVAHTTHDPRQLHRAQALLWLAEGDTVDEVASRLFTTPRTVFRWLSRFHARQALDVPARLADRPRSGRPKTVRGIIEPLISAVLAGDPQQYGYQSTVWTAPLLSHYLREHHHLHASRRSVGLALARLGIAWKRPRYDLARRSPTWRQAKGGLNEAWQGASARSS